MDDQNIWLTGGLINAPDAPPGTVEDFDVFFTWNLATHSLGTFTGASCRQFPGPETFTAYLVGNTIEAFGTCGSTLEWGGSVIEPTAPSSSFWIGQVWARDPPAPVSTPEPGILPLLLLALLIGAFKWRGLVV